MNSMFAAYSFFFDFLALAVLFIPVYFAMPWPLARRLILTFLGAYLLYFIAPRLVLFYALFWFTLFLFQNLIARTVSKSYAYIVLTVTIIATLVPMVFWKMMGDDFIILFNLIGNSGVKLISAHLWEIDMIRKIIIPIGVSFATFRAIDLLVKTYVGRLSTLSLDRVFFYGFFPPVQIVGPIIEYEEIQKRGDNPAPLMPQDIFDGCKRIATGLIKIFLFAFLLGKSANIFGAFEHHDTLEIWGSLVLFTWFFYLNFSGYSDLAIGSARLFGYTLKENFSFSYFKQNIREFWNHWHMGLTRFAQRNIFIPFGGYRSKTQHLATLATMMVIALWHDISVSMILFGLYHGTGLIIHRIYSSKTQKPINPPKWQVYAWGFGTYLFVVISFPLLVLPIKEAWVFYLALAGVRT